MAISKQYFREVQDDTEYTPTWLPTLTVSPGDVGVIKNYQYTPMTNLKDMGIPFDSVTGSVRADFDYYSADAVSREFKLKGEAPLLGSALTQADAGVRIKFSRSNAVVFRITGCRSSAIRDLHTLGKQVISLDQRAQWPEDYVVIREVVSAASGTILISSGSSAEIELAAEGTVRAAGLDLADVGAKFRVMRESNVSTRILASTDLTPLFKVCSLRKHWFRDTEFRGAKSAGSEPKFEVAFEDVDYDTFG